MKSSTVSEMELLVAARLVQGVGGALLTPGSLAMVESGFRRADRARAIGAWSGLSAMAGALGPLIGVVLFAAFGVRGTALAVVPGLTIGAFLLWQLRWLPGRLVRRAAGLVPRAPVPLLPMAMVIGVMMSRTWTIYVLESFIPTWYRSLGYPPSVYGPLATTVVLASAVGNVGVGALADRLGRRTVIVVSIVLSVPVVLLFVQFTGPVGFLTGALVGLLAASTAPLTLVMAQELMAGRTGLASGILLGLGFVTGAIGVPVTGAVADHLGLAAALRLQVLVVAAAIPLGLLLPSEKRLRALRQSLGKAPDVTPPARPGLPRAPDR